MSNHTPTPWHYAKATKQIFTPFGEVLRVSGIALPCGYVDPNEECFGNAEFIVRACNSHDELLEALIGLLDVTEDIVPLGSFGDKARAAIAKATVEKP